MVLTARREHQGAYMSGQEQKGTGSCAKTFLVIQEIHPQKMLNEFKLQSRGALASSSHKQRRENDPIKIHISGRLGGMLHALYMGVGFGMAGHRSLLWGQCTIGSLNLLPLLGNNYPPGPFLCGQWEYPISDVSSSPKMVVLVPCLVLLSL